MLALEKIISSFLALPGLLWLVWLIITVYLFKKGQSKAIYLLSLVSLILMYLLFTSLGTGFLVLPLENIYSADFTQDTQLAKYPIVILGGGIKYGQNKAYLSPYSLQRVVTGYHLYRKIGDVPLVFTGGVALGQKDTSESEIAASWLAGMGVKKQDIVIENQARTTYENGLYVNKWLLESYNKKPTIYLVTNAIHLPRAVRVFEKQGIQVIPVNAGIIVDHRKSWLDYLPNRNALNANMMGLHEWLGLIWYKVSGKI